MKFFLLLGGVLSFCILNAQFSSINTRGLPLKQPEIIELQDSGFLQLTQVDGNSKASSLAVYTCTAMLHQFDKDGQLLKQQKPDETKYRFNRLFTKLARSGNSYWMVYLEASGGRTIGNFKAARVMPGSLDIGDPKLIATEAEVNEKAGIFGGVTKDEHFILKSSPNSKFHFILIGLGNDDMFLSCFNEDMDPLWKKKFEIPGWKPDKLNSYSIDDDGNIYLGLQHNHKAAIALIDIKGNLTQKPLTITESPIDIQMHISRHSGAIKVSGFYGEKHHGKGIYQGTLDPKTLELHNSKYTLFSDSLLKRLKKDGLASLKKKHPGIWKFNYKSRLIEQYDGTMAMITEANANLGDGMGIGGVAIGSLLVFHLPEDSPVVISHIPRYAIVNFSNEQEYVALPGKHEIFLFYWDEASNLLRSFEEEQKVLKGFSNAALIGAAITNDGKIKRRQIFPGNNMQSALNFARSSFK